MDAEIDDRLTELFRAVFELRSDSDARSARQVTTTSWDSLGHVSLVTALESEFEIVISTVDSIEITSYEAARLLVQELLSSPT
jgi:acyl carrier protein